MMSKLSYLIFLGTILAVVIGFVGRMLFIKVGPHEIGVRTQEFAFLGEKGIYPHDYNSAGSPHKQPGWYRDLWMVDRWYKFDRTVHTLRMTGDRGEAAPLVIKSKDGYDVTVHVRIKYRIKEGEAWQLLRDVGPDRARYERLLENTATNACREGFGGMFTEQFYDPEAREAAAEKIKRNLQRVLDQRHLEVLDILISSVIFDPQYEQKIQSKKLADQDVQVKKSQATAATFKGETRKVLAETEALMKKIQAEYERTVAELEGKNSVAMTQIIEDANAYSTERRADADLLLEKAKAEADLLIKKAEADGERARTRAMAGDGGRVMVALEAARNLNIGSVDFSTLGVDVLDVREMAIKLGAPAPGR